MKRFGNIPAQCKGRKLRKKGGSSTSGKSKGLVPTTEERIFARVSRAYKLRGYADWAKRTNALNKGETRTN